MSIDLLVAEYLTLGVKAGVAMPRLVEAFGAGCIVLADNLARALHVLTRLLDLCRMELQEAMNRGWGDADRLKASTLQEERAGVRLRM